MPDKGEEPPKVGPSKAVARLSQDLERLLADAQLKQKAPKGMAKCPLCGAILEPTRNKKVRTHDNPVKGARCEASGQPVEVPSKPAKRKA